MDGTAPKRWIGIVGRSWPLAALAILSAFVHRDLLAGLLPARGDHLCHLFSAWNMAENLVPSGRVTGWSHMAFAGYPAGMYYPVGGDLYVTLLRYVTLGLLSWERTYTLALFGVLVSAPVVAYLLGRRVAGPVGAMVAGLLALGDVGGWRQGGSVFTIYWGVWPYMLAVTLSLAGLALVEPALAREARQRPLAVVGLAAVLAAAVMTHPIAAVFLAVAVPPLMIAFAVARRRRHRVRDVLARAALSGGLAAGLALFWLVPLAGGGGEWTESFGDAWMPLPAMWDALAANTLFDQFSRIAWALGLAGAVLGLASRRLWPTCLAGLAVGLLLFAALAGDAFSDKVQAERLSAFIKGLLFVLAGHAVDRAGASCAWAVRKAGKRLGFARIDRGLVPAAAVLGLALAAGIVAHDWDGHYAKVGRFTPLGGAPWQDVAAADGWVASQPRGTLDRVLYQPGPLCVRGNVLSRACRATYDSHIFASGPVRTGLPRIKFGFEPAATFVNLPLANHWPSDTSLIRRFESDEAALRNLGVRWIVSLADWPARPDLVERRRFGRVRVYERPQGQSSPVVVEGGGRAVVERFSDEEVAVRVEGASPGARLRFPIAYHPFWVATRDGARLPVTAADVVPGARRILVTVPAADGRTVLAFLRPFPHSLAGWVSLAAWLLAAAWLAIVTVRGRRRPAAGTR